MDISHTVSQMYCWIDIWVTVNTHFKRMSKRERGKRGEEKGERDKRERSNSGRSILETEPRVGQERMRITHLANRLISENKW